MCELLTHRQRFVAVLQLYDEPPRQLARYARDRVDVDDRGTMNLPELRWVELVRERLERFADQRLAIVNDDAGVFGIGLEVGRPRRP